MGSLSIQKGKRAERAVASLLNPILARVCQEEGVDPVKLQRNLVQTQQGGHDLVGVDWLAIEIKHHKTVSLPAWWRQTCGQAGCDENGTPISNRIYREPVLIWKQHGGKWNVRMLVRLEIEPGSRLRTWGDVSMDVFLQWFEARARLQCVKAAQDGLFD